MKIRSPVLVQGYNLAVDNSVGGKVVEGFSDLRKSLVEVLVVPRVQYGFATRPNANCTISVWLNFFCGDERYVALTLIGDLAKRNFAEKQHII